MHGFGIDEPVIEYSGSAVSSAIRKNLYTDHIGSITAITNSNGSDVEINQYDSYGIPGAQNVGRFAYTGQIIIPELGLYHYKARAYDPRIGRFLQTDPIGYDDQLNLYAYVGNDPINAIDPSGKVVKLLKAGYNVYRRAKKSGSFKQALKDEALNIADNIATLADGQITIDDAFAIVDLATGFGGEAKRLTGNSPVAKSGNKIPNCDLCGPPNKRGNAPIGNDGHPVELHHRNQEPDGPLDEITRTDHRLGDNFKKNHSNTGQEASQIDRSAWRKEQKDYWKSEWDSGRFDDL